MIGQSDLVQPELYKIQFQLYMNVVCITLWIHEFGVTIGSEISLIWKSPWSIPKLLFLLTRYLALINLVIEFLLPVLPNLNADTCQGMNKYIYLAMASTTLTSELILTIRVWAVYNRGRKMGVFLSTLFVVVFVARFIIEAFWVTTIENISSPRSLVPSGCYMHPRSHLYNIDYVIMLIFHSALLIVMFIKGYKELFDSSDLGIIKTSLKSIVYIDGMVYYIIFFLFSLVNLILNLTSTGRGADEFPTLMITFSTILSCRMLLRLRDYAKRRVFGDTYLSTNTSVMATIDIPLGFANGGSNIE